MVEESAAGPIFFINFIFFMVKNFLYKIFNLFFFRLNLNLVIINSRFYFSAYFVYIRLLISLSIIVINSFRIIDNDLIESPLLRLDPLDPKNFPQKEEYQRKWKH
jgi:hypothetical protein